MISLQGRANDAQAERCLMNAFQSFEPFLAVVKCMLFQLGSKVCKKPLNIPNEPIPCSRLPITSLARCKVGEYFPLRWFLVSPSGDLVSHHHSILNYLISRVNKRQHPTCTWQRCGHFDDNPSLKSIQNKNINERLFVRHGHLFGDVELIDHNSRP